jgi:hypothetical protein
MRQRHKGISTGFILRMSRIKSLPLVIEIIRRSWCHGVNSPIR